jgi:DNA-binding transcriptional LysR family regulator
MRLKDDVTPDQARIILAVRQHGSTVKAAEALLVTQSAISKAIGEAERRLGIDVFDRGGGRLTPRPDCEDLFELLQQVEQQWDALGQTADGLREGSALPLRIVATPSIGHGLVARAVRQLLACHPNARVQLHIGWPIPEISDGSAEIGFVFSPRVDATVKTVPLQVGRMVCLLHTDDPLRERATITPSDLRHRKFICFDRERSPLGWLVARAFEAVGETYTPFIEVPYCITAAHLSAHSCGPAIVDEFTLQGLDIDRLIVRPFVPEIEIVATLIYALHRPLSLLARTLISHLEDSVAPAPAAIPAVNAPLGRRELPSSAERIQSSSG